MSITLPPQFEPHVHDAVKGLINGDFFTNWKGFDQYFSQSPKYFDEYTDHGFGHINKVLDYAQKLIPDSFYKSFGDDEGALKNTVSVLVLSVLLHDLGMFIKEAGLNYLLGTDPNHCSKDCEVWKKRRDDFEFEMKHASGTVLDAVFPNGEPQGFDIRNKCFCAEFIRRYHHRIAYQIADEGFPGADLNTMLQSKVDNNDIIKLAGLIAMSHGMDLRNDEQELEQIIEEFGYHDNMPLRVPVYYLMAVLRLADWIDAGADRAPSIRSDMNFFTSPISEREWTLNQRITDRQWLWNTNTLHIIAKPQNSVEHVRLKSWFTAWQKELDLSWAVIGEKHTGKNYQLSIRRITSSLDQCENKNFVTRAMSVQVNPDIVKLLIAPLYGHDESYGVRELLQNAIDACNERREKEPGCEESRITVERDTENGLFTITDNGLGMTEDVIADYFLTVGASFRNSPQWYREFQDDDGTPKLARSGRFGIGALAAFLIGPEVTVTTRHYASSIGFKFTYSQEPGLLNVEKVSGLPVGTKIQIVMGKKEWESDNASFGIKWTDWYWLSTPKITYLLDGEEIAGDREMFDLKQGEDADGWFAYHHPDFETFHFSFKYPTLCNGIVIGDASVSSLECFSESDLSAHGYEGTQPDIAVQDLHNRLELDLARNEILSLVSAPDDLIREFCKYRIAQCLLTPDPFMNVSESSDYSFLISKKGYLSSDRASLLHSGDEAILLQFAATSNKTIVESIKKHAAQTDRCIGLIDPILNAIAFDIMTDRTAERPKFESLPSAVEAELLKDLKAEGIIGSKLYKPQLREGEHNLMLEALREYLPHERNGGWIPYDMEERKRMYPEAFEALEKYIDDIEQARQEKEKDEE